MSLSLLEDNQRILHFDKNKIACKAGLGISRYIMEPYKGLYVSKAAGATDYVLTGWTGSIEDYKNFADEMYLQGHRLITSVEQYKNVECVDRWYDTFKFCISESQVINKKADDVDVHYLKWKYNAFTIKNSGKPWNKHIFSIYDTEDSIKCSMLKDGYVLIRKYEDKAIVKEDGTPDVNRVYYVYGKALCNDENTLKFAERMTRLDNNFYAIDFLNTQRGYRLVDIQDGQGINIEDSMMQKVFEALMEGYKNEV